MKSTRTIRFVFLLTTCMILAAFAAIVSAPSTLAATGICDTASLVDVEATGGTIQTGYATVGAAFAAINAGTHTGVIAIEICGNTTEAAAPDNLNSSGAGSASYTSISIYPLADGLTITGSPAAGFGVLQLKGADNVTIDGDNPLTGGINRNLTIANTAVATSIGNSVIRIATVASVATSADSITIKNCILNGNVTAGNAAAITSTSGSSFISFGIYVGGNGGATAIDAPTALTSATAATAPSGTTVNALTIDNNAVNQCARAINFAGAATSVSTGVTITNNTVGGAGALAGTPPYTSPTTTVYSRGIFVQGTTAITITGNTVQNILSYVASTMTGIDLGSLIGTGTINISNNSITGVVNNGTSSGATGLALSAAGAPYTVSGNTVTNIQTLAGSTIFGIQLSTAAVSGTVETNKVTTVNSRGSTGFGAYGINLASGSAITVRNNFVSDINAFLNNSGISSSFGPHGIRVASGLNHKIYHNSVNLFGALTGATSVSLSSAFTITSTGLTGIDARNNIFSNTMTGSFSASSPVVSVWLPSGGGTGMGLTWNNNGYYQGSGTGAAIAQVGTTSLTGVYLAVNFNSGSTAGSTNFRNYTSGLLLANTNNDNASFATTSAAPFTSSTDLHIPAATVTQLESGGVGVGVATDIDGGARSVSTPDIGADEFVGVVLDLTAPSISYSTLPNTTLTTNRTLAITVTDASGVPTAGIGLPVIYYRKGIAGVYASTQCTFVSGSSYNCLIDYTNVTGGSVTTGDTLQYYVAAQDTAGNVATNPSGGAGGFTTNPPAASTPPTTPSSYLIAAPYSGTKTICASGCTYTTLTGAGGAFSAINSSVVTGAITLEIDGDLIVGEDGSNALNALTEEPAGSGFAVNIYPGGIPLAPDALPRLITSTTAPAGGFIRLNGADNVTIDGAFGGVGSTRDMTITEANTGTTSAVIWLQSNGADGATNNKIKNLNVVGNSNTTTLIGIGSGGTGTTSVSTSSLGTGNNSNTIQNNNISKVQYGIYSQGSSAGLKNTGNVITQNLMNTASPNNVAKGGIWLGFENNIQVTQNTIDGVTLAGSPDVFGIALGLTGLSTSGFTGNDVTNATVTRNFIGKVTNTGTFSAAGITVASTTSGTTQISNNSIYGVGANGTSGDFGAAIFLGGGAGSTTQVYFNSVSMTGTFTGGSYPNIGLAIGGSDPTVDVRDNVFFNTLVNGTGTSYAIATAAATFASLTSNNNDFFTTTGATFAVGKTGSLAQGTGSDQVSLGNWQTTTGKDLASIPSNPSFNSTTNLQPLSGSPVLDAGTSLSGTVTPYVDITGSTRVDPPSMGAYELAADTAGPIITYTNLTDTASIANRTLVTTITDTSGVGTSGGAPRIYYRKGVVGVFQTAVATSNVGSSYTFTIDNTLIGGVTGGDVIQYYVAAQDLAGAPGPNVSTNPAGGSGINPPGTTAPGSPNSYQILITVSSFPYCQDFESGAAGWSSAINTGLVNNWVLGTPAKTQIAAAHSGTNAWVTKTTGTYDNSHDAYVQSPVFNFSSLAIDPTISFWQNFKTEAGWDAGVLEISTNGGTVWTKVDANLGSGGTFNTANSTGWYNSSSINGPVVPPKWSGTSTAYTGSASGWIKSTSLLVGIAGQTDVRFRWRFGSDTSGLDEGWAIDDICLSADDVSAPVIVYTALANTLSTSNRTLPITVTDNVGVPTAGVGLPRLYFRKGTSGAYFTTPGACSYGGGNNYTCTIDYSLVGGVVAGDTIQYYVVAQDTAAPPNVSVNPAAGASGLTANPPAAGTPPTTPNSYLISTTAFSGSYDVPTGTYLSLTNPGGIFEAINNGVLTSNVTINITGDLTGETGTVALNQMAEDGSGPYTLLIKPSGAARSISGPSTASGMIILNGADRVTIDGSLSGSTDRSLSIVNTNTTATVLWIRSASASNGANNDTIKNCIISGTAGSTVVGVLSGGNAFGATADSPNSDNTIRNNLIKSVQNALFLSGNAATLDQNWLVTGNTFGSTLATEKLAFRGMLIGNAQNMNVSNNTIMGVLSSASTSSTMTGIQVAFTVNGGTISGNKISDIKQINTGGWGSNGIWLGASSTASNLTVANNVIYDVASYGYDFGTAQSDNGYGIMVDTGGGYKIYYNSVRMTTNQTVGIPAAINISSGITTAASLDIRDNAFANTMTVGTRYAIYCSATNAVFGNIDYNDYYPGTGTLGFLGGAQATIAAWRTASGQDLASFSADPLFNSTTDLRPQTGSPLIGAGTPVAVLTDITGGTRSVTTPTVGAYEPADLSVTKTDAADPVAVGSNIVYTITVSNSGSNSAVNTILNESTPANTTFVSLSNPAGWTCITPVSGGTGAISCTNANFAAGASSVFTLTVKADYCTGNTTDSNTASVTSDAWDPNSTNDSALETTGITDPGCDDGIACTTDGPCIPSSGCVHTPVNSVCDDSNDCTTDVCVVGVGCQYTDLSAGTPCGNPNPSDCSNPDTCNGTGACNPNDVVDGTACTSDGNTCTTDACASGVCTHPNLPDGTSCNDGSGCTNPDTCTAGTCTGPIVCRDVKVPANTDVCAGGNVVVPITVDAATGVVSMDFKLTYNPAVVVPIGVSKTPFTNNFTLTTNLTVPGVVTLSLFSATPLNGSGEVAWVVFHAVGAPASSSALHWTQHDLNEGNIPSSAVDGTITVDSVPVVISMPVTASGAPGSNVAVPINVNSANGLHAFDITVRFLPTVINSISASTTAATAGWTLTTNFSTPGTAVISLFSVTPLSGTSVDVATITFNVTGGLGDVSPLDITVGTTDDGVDTCLSDGLFTVCADADGDGYTVCGGDCNDNDPAIHPGVPDTDCDGVDDDCNGTADDGYVPTPTACGTAPCDSTGLLICTPGGILVDTCNPASTNGNSCTSDGNSCTDDVCAAGTCTHPAVPDTTPCSDGDACTTLDTCLSGVCTGGPAPNCDDGNPCTTDTCISPTGCDNAPSCTIAGHIYYNKVTPAGPNPPNPGTDGPDLTKPIKGETVLRTSDLSAPANAITDATGLYQFLNDIGGNVTLTPQDLLGEEDECQASITAADASKIAQAAVGLTVLTPNQFTAADVTNNGTVSSLDASFDAQKAVAGSCTGFQLPVETATGSAWAWAPTSRNYNPLTGLQNYDFIGILYGDVTGNWSDLPPLTGADAPGGGLSQDQTAVDSMIGRTAVTTQTLNNASLYRVSGPLQRVDGRWDIVLGIQNSDGILGIDMVLHFDPTKVAIRNVAATGIAAGFNLEGNNRTDGYALAMYGVGAMHGTGQFLVVTYDVLAPVSGQPFDVAAQANEGQILLTPGGTRLDQHALDGGNE